MLSLADAIINENQETVLHFLHRGADVNQLDEYGFTPLIESAIADNFEMASLLVRHGAAANLQDATGGTALHWAAENNNVALATLLLQHGANPNAYTFAGQPVLVMPLLRRQKAMRQLLIQHGASLLFAQDYVNAKLLGHVFELVGKATIISPDNQFVELDFEGFYLEVTLGLIAESLFQFKNHFAAREMRRYESLSGIMVDAFERAAQLIKYQQYRMDVSKHEEKINLLISTEPLIIPVGYEGHAITFVKFGNVLVRCDRREDSRIYDTVMFYQMQHADKMTPAFAKKLIYEKQSDYYINEALPAELGFRLITELKVPAQISGNCSWANVEACIPTLFFILSSTAKDFYQEIPRYKSLSMHFFNQWREWNKARALNFCIQSFHDADSVRKATKAEILAAILFQCLTQEEEKNHERVETILSIIGKPPYDYVLQNYVRSYSYEDQGPEGKAFLKLLRAYGYLDK